ncbi:MAG TPA: HAD family hydrolase [Thermoanaerobaculia bacterium]
MKKIRAVLFDAGGTLIHVDGQRVCGAAGLPYDSSAFQVAEASAVATVRAWVLENPGSKDLERLPLYLDTMLKDLGLSSEPERRAAARRVAAEHHRANLWSRRADEAAETLEALRGRGYRLAVVSNADGRVRHLLESAGLASLLEFILDSAEVGVEKPDPRIFHAATEWLGLSPSACAYVGDIYEIDIAGAKRAGLEPVLLGSSPAPEPVLRIPDLPSLLSLFPGFA